MPSNPRFVVVVVVLLLVAATAFVIVVAHTIVIRLDTRSQKTNKSPLEGRRSDHELLILFRRDPESGETISTGRVEFVRVLSLGPLALRSLTALSRLLIYHVPFRRRPNHDAIDRSFGTNRRTLWHSRSSREILGGPLYALRSRQFVDCFLSSFFCCYPRRYFLPSILPSPRACNRSERCCF